MFPKFLNLSFCFIIKNIMYNFKIKIYELKFFKLPHFQFCALILFNLINDDAFVSAATADTYSMVHLVCLFMKTHLLMLMQDNCPDLVCCAYLSKLTACVRNITTFCQHLLRPILSARFGRYRYIGKT